MRWSQSPYKRAIGTKSDFLARYSERILYNGKYLNFFAISRSQGRDTRFP